MAAAEIGLALDRLDEATASGLIAAGLASVLIFSAVALVNLRRETPVPQPEAG